MIESITNSDMRYDLHISHYIVLDQGHNPKRAQSLIRGKQMKMNICCPIFIAMLTNMFAFPRIN